MRKTIILSMDILFAATIFVAFLIYINYFYEEDSFDNKMLHSLTKNTLLYLDEPLQTNNQFFIQGNISIYLPSILSYQIKIDYYDNSLDLINTSLIGDDLRTDFVVVKRLFTTSNGFGIADMRVWLE